MTYRDPFAGLRAQVAEKHGRLVVRLGELGPVARAIAPPRLKALREPVDLTQASIDALAALEAQYDQLSADFDAFLLKVERGFDAPHDVPDPPRPRDPTPYLFEEQVQLSFRRRLQERLDALAPDEQLVRWGDTGYLARFRSAEGAPMIWWVRGLADRNATAFASFEASLRTSLPAEVGAFAVEPETFVHRVGKAVGWVREIEVGEREFDDGFLVRGDEELAQALLSDRMRRRFVELSPCGPVLRVRDGIAELSLRGAWAEQGNDALPVAVMEIVSEVRRRIEGG